MSPPLLPPQAIYPKSQHELIGNMEFAEDLKGNKEENTRVVKVTLDNHLWCVPSQISFPKSCPGETVPISLSCPVITRLGS